MNSLISRNSPGLGPSLLLILACTGTVCGQITVDATASWLSDNDPGTLDASGSDKLVVVVTGEHHFGNTNGQVNGVTYDGAALTQATNLDPESSSSITASDIWYLDNPLTATGSIDVSFSGNNWVVTAFALSGTDPGVGATAISVLNSKSVDLTTTAADSLVIAYHTMGGDHTGGGATGNTANVGSVDADPPLVEQSALEEGSNWTGHVTATADVAAAGLATYSFTGGSTVGVRTIAAEFLKSTAPPDTTPPTLASSDIVDDQAGGPIADTTTVVYTVTFNEGMDPASIGTDDFENAGSPAATIDSVTGGGAVYTVMVTPGTGDGTLQLQVKAGAILKDAAGNDLDTTSAIADDTIITVNGDMTPPMLSGVGIVDDKGGGPIFENQSVLYTVTFDEPMNASTVEIADFEDGGTSGGTIDSVTATGDPAVFEVSVTAGGAGTLLLQVAAGANIEDVAGNALDTAAAIPDDTTITVNAGSPPPRSEVMVDGTAFWNSGSSPVSGTFDASGSDKLVVVITGEHGHNTADGDVTSVTYDGVELTRAVDRNAMAAATDTVYNEIWYLDDPATSTGDIVANVVNRGNVTVLGLSGTAPGVGATAISPLGTRSVGLTTLTENSLVIASFGMGGNGNTANVGAVDADAPLTEVSAQENGSLWDGHVTGQALVASAGAGTYAFTGGDASGAHVIAAEFQGAIATPPVPLTLVITPDGNSLDMSWNSLPGMQYDLLSSDDPEAEPDPSLWAIYNDGVTTYENIPATGLMTTLDDVLKVGSTRFFVLVEEVTPPLLMEDFEGGDGGFTVSTVQGTDWAHGDPDSGGPGGSVLEGNGSSTNCWGTGIGSPGYYIDPTDTCLRSPIINLVGVTEATLSFAQALDLEVGDTVAINIIDDTTDAVIAADIFTINDGDDLSADWESVGPIALPAAAYGQAVRIEWCLSGVGGGTDDYLGWYIDDVSVLIGTP